MRDMVRRDFLHTVPGLVMAANAWEASAAQTPTSRAASGIAASVEALVFDTFGTVVDYRSTIIAEGTALGKAKGLKVDWAKFADAWRSGYGPAMSRVRKGELPWTKLDVLHRMILDKVLDDFQITGLTEAEKDDFNKVWHRLKPWPDAVSGLTRLKRRYIIAPLSNGNVRLMVDMANTTSPTRKPTSPRQSTSASRPRRSSWSRPIAETCRRPRLSGSGRLSFRDRKRGLWARRTRRSRGTGTSS